MSGFSMRRLGKTGLQVSPLGIGGGSGIQSQDLLYAFERGINYFFFSSDLHHCVYQRSVEALRTLCGQGSAVRDKVVLATVSYVDSPDPHKVLATLMDQFAELGVDYIDVFHWGWITDDCNFAPLVKRAFQLKGDSAITRGIRHLQLMEMGDQAMEINEALLKRGLVRCVGASFHSRRVARTWMRNLDVLMLRYNLAHRGVEQDIVPFLYGEKERDPGIVVFNAAHEGTRLFHISPRGYPSDWYVPSIPDCYRFALSNPWVDVVLTGMKDRVEIDHALAALEKGPLGAEEYDAMFRYASYKEASHTSQPSLL